MPTTFYGILTNLGKQKIADAIANGTTVVPTQMALGDGNGVAVTPNPAQTSLVNQVYKNNLSAVIKSTGVANQVACELYLDYTVGPFTIREAGIYDADDDLIAVASYPAYLKTTSESGAPSTLVIRIYLIVESTAAISAIVTGAGSYDDLSGLPQMGGKEIKGVHDVVYYGGVPSVGGKVPASYLPSYVDDVIELLTISDTAPTEGLIEGDQYFAPTAKKIYTYSGTEWDTGVDPEKGKIYIALNTNLNYRWSGTVMVLIGGGNNIEASNVLIEPISGLDATNAQEGLEEINTKTNNKANLVDGKVPLTELPELGGTAADITPITATSGSVSLEANKAYKMTAQGDITITLPATETLDTDKVNKTNLHLRNEKASLAISFPGVIMFKDGKDFSAIAPGHYYICFEYNSLAERWEADIKQQKFSGATVRKVADFSSEIPAGYVVSHVAYDGAALETAANNTAELVFPLQDTPYDPAFQRMQWPYSPAYVIRYKIKMPSARKILGYSVTGWAENGSIADRILKSFRVWAATTDVDITASNWKDNCKLIDEQINAFTTSDHNVTKKFAVALDVDAVCLIIEPTANQNGGYVCLGQIRFFGE